MDQPAIYSSLIKQALRDYVALVQRTPELPYQVVTIFDDETRHYVVRKVGWTANKRILKTVLHVTIQNGKIWIEEDLTEEGIATYFLEHGVPSSAIVLGFQPPQNRLHTEFALA